jgi:hypothetical protein
MPLLPLLSKTEKRQNDEDHDHETDEIDDVVHRLLLGVCQCLPLHRAQHVPDPTCRTQASAQGVLGELFPLIFEFPALTDSIARGGMVSGARRGND